MINSNKFFQTVSKYLLIINALRLIAVLIASGIVWSSNDAIESKQIAEQRAKQAENELMQVEIEAKQVVVKADAEKEAKIRIAEGKAKEIELLTQAEGKFHKTLSEVATASSLTLRFIERWDGVLPKVMGEQGPFELSLPASLLESNSIPQEKIE